MPCSDDAASSHGLQFERRIAAIFRALGAKVQHDVALAGNQIDLLVEEATPSGAAVKIAIECKAYARPIGVGVINAFAGLTTLLKQRSLIDRSILVSEAGFTRSARQSAEVHGVELLELADLEARV